MPDTNIPQIPEHDKIEGEEWRAIPGFEDLYAVSNLGRVMNIARGPSRRPGRILKGMWMPERYPDGRCRRSGGYINMALLRGGKAVRRSVHFLVAESFLGPRPNGHEINHRNGIKTDNRVDNLEWVTRGDNIRHAVAMGLHRFGRVRGEQHGMAKLRLNQVVEIRSLKLSGMSSKEIALRFGIGRTQVDRIVSGTRWKHL